MRVTPQKLIEVQEEILARFTEKMNNGEEPCSTWWGNPSLDWITQVEPREEGPIGFAWTY